ncbi:MAG: phosphoribosyltransferase family protein [Candidatus Roizmanbacteria bacterium]|nr:phosphoribosyltransferase family protein [Candidatus Roizmanbacteria bacterium]
MVVANPERLQHKKSLPTFGVIEETFYNYAHFIEQFTEGFPMDRELYVDSTTFKNREAWLKVVLGNKGRQSDLDAAPRAQAIVPFWISTQFGEEAHVRKTVERMVNALTRTERGREPLVAEAMGVSPFIEMRQDKDGPGDGKGDREVGEANEAQLTARDLLGLKKLLVLGPHSYEGIEEFKAVIEDVVSVTATPLFAEHIKTEYFEKGIIDPKNLRVVALDKGSLEQCIKLSEQLDLPPSEHIVAFDKSRKGHNMIGKLMLQYGDPKDMMGKDIIIYDDIIDTFGSMTATCKELRETYKCKSITIVATHGVLSHPARGNIIDSLDANGTPAVVDHVIMSDSLPRAKYAFKGVKGVTIIPVSPTLSMLARLFSKMSGEEMISHPISAEYILDPQDKELVWEDFKERYALADRINVPDEKK